MIKRISSIKLVHQAQDQSMSPLIFDLVKAVFEDDDDGVKRAEDKLIQKTPSLTVIPGIKKPPNQ